MMDTITITRCTDCGMESVPYFGMFAPCPVSQSGSHANLEYVAVAADETLAAKLRAAYNTVASFDRAKFDRHASPKLKRLLNT